MLIGTQRSSLVALAQGVLRHQPPPFEDGATEGVLTVIERISSILKSIEKNEAKFDGSRATGLLLQRADGLPTDDNGH